jgi:hypothetical protein
MKEGDKVFLRGHPDKIWTVTSASEKYIWLDGIPGGHARTDFTVLVENPEPIEEVIADVELEIDVVKDKTHAITEVANVIQEVAEIKKDQPSRRQIIAATVVSFLIFGAVLVSIIW